MKSKQKLIMAILGLALFATPINALAYRHDTVARARTTAVSPGRNFAATRSTSFSHPAAVRSFSNRNFARNATPMTRSFRANPAINNWRGNRFLRNRGAYDYNYNRGPGYGYAGPSEMYGAGVPAYGPSYAGLGYGGGACSNVQRLENQVRRDRNTGHPAAANDLLHRMRFAESRCGSGSLW
ncbi:MAG: hypothetical protein WA740_11000 [Candidatus Binataceae bacterium]